MKANTKDWQPIESAPKDRVIRIKVLIVPSPACQANGGKEFWDIAEGRWLGFCWSNILGGKASHWQPLEAHQEAF